MVTVFIPRRLQVLTGGARQVVVAATATRQAAASGVTVRQVIDALDAEHPGLKARLYDPERDALHRGMAVSVDGVAIEQGLLGRVGPDSEVHFLPAIAGGGPRAARPTGTGAPRGAVDTPIPADYALAEIYADLVDRVRSLSPAGLTEVWGVVEFRGPDFRLQHRAPNGQDYRLIGLAPLATRVTVWMAWDRLFALHEAAADDDTRAFAAAFPRLSIRNRGQPWNARSLEETQSAAATDLLRCGMRLMVRDIDARHPA